MSPEENEKNSTSAVKISAKTFYMFLDTIPGERKVQIYFLSETNEKYSIQQLTYFLLRQEKGCTIHALFVSFVRNITIKQLGKDSQL